MKCSKCGKKLDITPGKSVNFCSNCGNKVAVQSVESIDSADAALRYIADNFGADTLLGSKIVSCFADITRSQFKDEKDLIKILSDKGALECLKEATQQPVSEQEISIKRAMTKLPTFLQDSEYADIMLRSFAAALGWQLQKPQTVPHHPIVQQQPIQQQTVQQTQKLVLPNTSAESAYISVCPSVGSVIRFGGIDWCVLAVENNRALLLSEKILEKRPYTIANDDMTWERCTLRKYLNTEFYNKLGAEKSAIADTRNLNWDNLWYGTSGGNATTDKVFLLSIDEVDEYFGNSGDYANKRRKDTYGKSASDGYYIDNAHNKSRIATYGSERASWWWLRSPGLYSSNVASVIGGGAVNVFGGTVRSGYGGVRPALCLNL